MKGAGKEEMDGLMEWVDIGKNQEGECSLDSHVALLCCLAPVILAPVASMRSLHLGPWPLCALGGK